MFYFLNNASSLKAKCVYEYVVRTCGVLFTKVSYLSTTSSYTTQPFVHAPSYNHLLTFITLVHPTNFLSFRTFLRFFFFFLHFFFFKDFFLFFFLFFSHLFFFLFSIRMLHTNLATSTIHLSSLYPTPIILTDIIATSYIAIFKVHVCFHTHLFQFTSPMIIKWVFYISFLYLFNFYSFFICLFFRIVS